MAELLAAGGWNGSGSLGAYLREMLPDEYVVVTDPMIHGCVFGAIVVGPQGLTVLQAKDGTGEVAAEHDNVGQTTRQSNWLLEAALRAFLKDEFPALHPEIRSYIAERDTEAVWPIWRVAGTDGAVTGNLADVIAASDALARPGLGRRSTARRIGDGAARSTAYCVAASFQAVHLPIRRPAENQCRSMDRARDRRLHGSPPGRRHLPSVQRHLGAMAAR